MSTVDQIFQQKGLWEWWLQNGGNGTNVFNGTTEKGIDYSNGVVGTPIGAIASGTVVSVEHTNSAINDIVEISGNGGLWLYQHIISPLKVGQTINVGDVVGTERGLTPSGGIDQYSTGPHIEVRHAASYQPGIYSWNQAWTDPKAVFMGTGSGSATPSSNAPVDWWNPVQGVSDTAGAINNAAIAINNAGVAINGISQFTGNVNSFIANTDWRDSAIRAVLIVVGIVVVVGGLYLFVSQ